MNYSYRAKESMLIEVSDDCQMLQLADGSQWNVEPTYMPTIATWIPTANVRVRYVEPDSPWPYELLNTENDISVRAMRIKRRETHSKEKGG